MKKSRYDNNGALLPPGIMQTKTGSYKFRFMYEGQCYTGTEATLAKCKAAMRAAQRDAEDGLSGNKDLTYKEWADQWLESKEHTVRQATYKSYSQAVRLHAVPAFGNKRLKRITVNDIQKMLNSLAAAGFTENSLKVTLTIISSSFEAAVHRRLIRSNPCKDGISFPTDAKESTSHEYLTAEECKKLLETITPEYRDILLFMRYSGTRPGEARALEWENVDFENKRISITGTLTRQKEHGPDGGFTMRKTRTKTKQSNRVIVMSDDMADLLSRVKVQQKEQQLLIGPEWEPMDGLESLVFTRWNGSAIPGYLLEESCTKAAKKAGINKKVTPHCFRATFATEALNKGVPISTVAAILGHSKIETTAKYYVTVTEEQQENAFEMMQDRLKISS